MCSYPKALQETGWASPLEKPPALLTPNSGKDASFEEAKDFWSPASARCRQQRFLRTLAGMPSLLSVCTVTMCPVWLTAVFEQRK